MGKVRLQCGSCGKHAFVRSRGPHRERVGGLPPAGTGTRRQSGAEVGRFHTNTQKIKEAKTLTDVTGADVTARSEGKSRPVVEAPVLEGSGPESALLV